MPSILFTDLSIQSLKWNGKHTNYFDRKLPSFGVRVGKNRKTFIIVKGRERIASTIGHYPDLTLQDAKKQAKLALITPTDAKSQLSYETACDAFLEAMEKRLKPDTVSQYRNYLETLDLLNFPPTKQGVNEALKHFDGKPWAQNYAYAALRAFLNWCLEQEYIDKHPLIRGRPPNKTKSRERVLSDDELGRVWRCTEDNTYGRILRILILHGQRRIEARNLKPADVADGLITYHTKGDKINVLPVTPLVEANLTLPFKFNNWTDSKARFDADCGVEFRHHDLRRTLATKLAGMGVSVVVIERILGHTQGGVHFTYNRHTYLAEAKAALLLYEAHIRTLAEKA